MPVDLQYLGQSLQSLTLDEDPTLENEAVALASLTPQPPRRDDTDALHGGGFVRPTERTPLLKVSPAPPGLRMPQIVVPSAPPLLPQSPPSVPPRKRLANPAETSVRDFCKTWHLDGALCVATQALFSRLTAAHRDALITHATKLFSKFHLGTTRVAVLQELNTLWGMELTWLARDIGIVLSKMSRGDERRLSVVCRMRRMSVADRTTLMQLVQNSLLDLVEGEDSTCCMMHLVRLSGENLHRLCESLEELQTVMTAEDACNLVLLSEDERDRALEELRIKGATQKGVNKLGELFGLQGPAHVTLHRALSFVNDARLHPATAQRVLDYRFVGERSVRARASDKLRALHGYCHRAAATADQTEDARLFSKCWYAAEAHPTVAYALRFMLALELTNPHVDSWDFRRSVLVLLHEAYPQLALARLVTPA